MDAGLFLLNSNLKFMQFSSLTHHSSQSPMKWCPPAYMLGSMISSKGWLGKYIDKAPLHTDGRDMTDPPQDF